MLYYENEKWQLKPLKATYEQDGDDVEKYIVEPLEIEPYEEMGHIKNLEIEEAEYPKKMTKRLKEVEDFTDQEFNAVEHYVIENKVLPGTTLATQKQMESVEKSVLEIAMLQGGPL